MKLNRRQLRRLIEGAIKEHIYSNPVVGRDAPYVDANREKYQTQSKLMMTPERAAADIKRVAEKYNLSVRDKHQLNTMDVYDVNKYGNPDLPGASRGDDHYSGTKRAYNKLELIAKGVMREPIGGFPGGFSRNDDLKNAKKELENMGYTTTDIRMIDGPSYLMSQGPGSMQLYGDGVDYIFGFEVASSLATHA